MKRIIRPASWRAAITTGAEFAARAADIVLWGHLFEAQPANSEPRAAATSGDELRAEPKWQQIGHWRVVMELAEFQSGLSAHVACARQPASQPDSGPAGRRAWRARAQLEFGARARVDKKVFGRLSLFFSLSFLSFFSLSLSLSLSLQLQLALLRGLQMEAQLASSTHGPRKWPGARFLSPVSVSADKSKASRRRRRRLDWPG